MTTTRTLSIAAVLAAALMAQASAASAACVTKAGMGSGGDMKAAKFQAWEAVLQATDWGMWSSWITSSAAVGTAPGYAVSKLKTSCSTSGTECRMQATLCK